MKRIPWKSLRTPNPEHRYAVSLGTFVIDRPRHVPGFLRHTLRVRRTIKRAEGMVGYAMRDNELAMTALMRAVALSPNSVNAHGLLANAHSFGGRSNEALAYIDHAVRLSPRDTFLSDFQLYYCFAHFQGARYQLALQYAQQAHRMRPGHPYPLLLGAACAGVDTQNAIALVMRPAKKNLQLERF